MSKEFLEKKEGLPLMKQEDTLLAQIIQFLVQEKMVEPEEKVKFLKLVGEEKQS